MLLVWHPACPCIQALLLLRLPQAAQLRFRLLCPACLGAGAALVHERVIMLAAHWWVLAAAPHEVAVPQLPSIIAVAHAYATIMPWLCGMASFQPPCTAQFLTMPAPAD